MSDEVFWTVDVWSGWLGWTEWTSWVNRSNAEAERANAREQGYDVRIRRAA
jgi:hypothetical protein